MISRALLYTLITLTIFIALVCLGIQLEALRTHRTEDLPYWTTLLFIAVSGLIIWPNFKRNQ
ncbi:hypothetical protein [Larkinella arboricola]